jgi:hypothetical protein
MSRNYRAMLIICVVIFVAVGYSFWINAAH